MWRKRPVVIEARQWLRGPAEASRIINWVLMNGGTARYIDYDENGQQEFEFIEIDTLEGSISASPGDFIIKGVKDEFYPCKPDIFHLTYEFHDVVGG
jgi:hypothetical protein